MSWWGGADRRREQSRRARATTGESHHWAIGSSEEGIKTTGRWRFRPWGSSLRTGSLQGISSSGETWESTAGHTRCTGETQEGLSGESGRRPSRDCSNITITVINSIRHSVCDIPALWECMNILLSPPTCMNTDICGHSPESLMCVNSWDPPHVWTYIILR